MMSRNVRGFMSLFHSDKPVVCKVHGFCVAGGTDMALCSDLLVIEDDAKIGYPPARVWGSPTTARLGVPDRDREGEAAAVHRRLPVGRRGRRVGPRDRVARRPRSSTSASSARSRASRGCPINQLVMMKLLLNQTLHGAGAAHDADPRHGVRRHHASHAGGLRVPATRPRRAGAQAVRDRDEPFGDYGLRWTPPA